MAVKKYSEAKKRTVIKRVRAGETAGSVATDLNIPKATVYKWSQADKKTGIKYRKLLGKRRLKHPP